MLNIQGLYAGYSGTSVLTDVSLDARSGEVTVIVGPNGCGKSTLLKAVCGILPARGGQIFLDGQDLCAHPQSLAESIAALGVYGVHAPRVVSEAAARALLEQTAFPAPAQIEALDDAFIARNLSPGGCADLLAATYFLDSLL